MTAALALLRARPFDVEVYEQASEFAEMGAGDCRFGERHAKCCTSSAFSRPRAIYWREPTGKKIRLWNTGETWKLFDLGAESVARYGAPYFMIHRADLHGVLIDAVRSKAPDAIRLGARCAGFGIDGGSRFISPMDRHRPRDA